MANVFNSFKNIWSGGTGNTTLNATQSISPISTSTGTGISGIPPQYTISPSITSAYEDTMVIESVKKYCELVGDTLEYIYTDKTMTTSDPKVSILKVAQEREVIKDVGFRLDSNRFYVIRVKE